MSMIGSKATGFTIVELLIVIVIIAILAAISIVSYNGVQDRARSAQLASGVNAYYKAIMSYKSINGTYPTFTGCLGANYPSNQCWVGNNGTYSVNASLDLAIAEFINPKPTLATALLPLTTAVDSRAGLLYLYDSAIQSTLRYYVKGLNQQCISNFNSSNDYGQTTCIAVLN